MHKPLLPLALVLACGALSARADVLVAVMVDTHTLAGTSGYVDFQFNPGPFSTQSATLDIEKFAGAGYLAGSQVDTGGASGGPLPATVALTNSSVYNDDFEGVKFGNTLTFTLDFGGSAISAPNGTALSGSSFAFSLFDASGVNPLLTTDPNGFAAIADVNTNGTVSVMTPSSSVSITPEPASFLMIASGLSLLGIVLHRRIRPTRSGLVSKPSVCP